MSTLAPLTPGRFVTTWTADPWVLGALLLLAAGYGLGMRAAARHGDPWPVRRLVLWLVAGLGGLAIGTLSSLDVYGRVLLWPAAVQVTLLVTVVPIGLALGDPIGLWRTALDEPGRARFDRVLSSAPARVLTFPLVGAVLAVVTQLVVFESGYLAAAERHAWVLHLLELQLVVTGALFALPLLGVELLPAWANQGLRMAFAAVDGLLDAIPGIVVMTAAHLVAGGYYGTTARGWGPSPASDQTIAGGLVLTLSEVVALPFVALLFVAWVREDSARARAIDRDLDATAAPVRRTVADGVVSDRTSTRPWWETDPGPLADRARRYGWADDEPAHESGERHA